MKHSRYRLLNLGCGGCFHPDWVNLDFVAASPAVIRYDLRLGVPFADESADLIYHSHLLEHFPRAWGERFIADCFRVLKPGALLRVAVPDLENIVRAYLAGLDEARLGLEGAVSRHEWMLIELLDQMVRRQPGGDMANYWRRPEVPQEEFIRARCGSEFDNFRKLLTGGPEKDPGAPLPRPDAAFAQSGEIHRWMYDALSLRRLLESVGFGEVTRQSCATSLWPEVTAYGLDSAPDGTARKPDSLFMEAVKPRKIFPAAAPGDALGAAPIRVALFSSADAGGAGIAARRQHAALREAGVGSVMYVSEQHGNETAVYVPPLSGQNVLPIRDSGGAALSGLGAAWRRIDKELKAYPRRPDGLELFSPTGGCAELGALPLLEDFDLLHLHWVAQFVDLTGSGAALRGRPLVWTLHDMRPFTGGCHYSGGCRRFTEECGACPQLGSTDGKDLSFQNWRLARRAYRTLDLTVVSPSAWLAEQARASSLFRDVPVHVIGNPHPLDLFRPLNKARLRREMGIGEEDLLLVFSAQSLNNRRKGMYYLDKALAMLADGPLRDILRILLLGVAPPDFSLPGGLKGEALGHVNDPGQVALLYAMADGVVAPSLEDNAPNVICEAAGCGVPVIAFNAGGIPEMVRHGETGWLAEREDAAGLAAGVRWLAGARKNPALSLRCRALALERWSAPSRAADYKALYEAILAERGQKTAGRGEKGGR